MSCDVMDEGTGHNSGSRRSLETLTSVIWPSTQYLFCVSVKLDSLSVGRTLDRMDSRAILG